MIKTLARSRSTFVKSMMITGAENARLSTPLKAPRHASPPCL